MPTKPSPHRWRSLSRFLVVGLVGFGVDGGLLSGLLAQGWTIVQARAVSFVAAVSLTWWLNRIWTFKGSQETAGPLPRFLAPPRGAGSGHRPDLGGSQETAGPLPRFLTPPRGAGAGRGPDPGGSQPNAPRREYLLYFVTQLGGALINLLVFFALVHAVEPLRHMPLIPLAAGAAVAIAFNYSVSRLVVFKRRPP